MHTISAPNRDELLLQWTPCTRNDNPSIQTITAEIRAKWIIKPWLTLSCNWAKMQWMKKWLISLSSSESRVASLLSAFRRGASNLHRIVSKPSSCHVVCPKVSFHQIVTFVLILRELRLNTLLLRGNYMVKFLSILSILLLLVVGTLSPSSLLSGLSQSVRLRPESFWEIGSVRSKICRIITEDD